MKQDGYDIHLIFLWLPDVKLALARIADRVRKGGHNIPDRDVKRRFTRGVWNLFHVYQKIFNTWSIFDNSTGNPEPIAKTEDGATTVLNKSKHEQVLKQAGYKNGV